MPTVYLISCSRSKAIQPVPARDLYTSPLFSKARALAESRADDWYILSARHGLVHPDTKLAPYDQTLGLMPEAMRQRWASDVLEQIVRNTTPADSIVILAGLDYRKHLVPSLQRLGYSVSTPLSRMSIGQQLQWLT